MVALTRAQTTIGIEKTWGLASYEEAYGVAVSPDGSIYVVGETAIGGDDAFILKYASNGTLLWQKTWGGGSQETFNDYASDVAVDQSGNVYVVGSTQSFASGPSGEDAFILKYGPDGNLLWQKTWGGYDVESAEGVAIDQSGNLYVVGHQWTGGDRDAFILKLDSNGNGIWARGWRLADDEYVKGVAVDRDGNVYVAGFTGGLQDFWWYGDVFLVKFNSSGYLLWEKTWGGEGYDSAGDVTVDQYGNIYVVGKTDSFGLVSPMTQIGDAFILKYAPDGTLQWQKTWGDGGGDGIDDANGVTVDQDGAVYVVGETHLGSGSLNAFILKYDGSGNLLWQKIWGSQHLDRANDVASGSVCLVGYTYSSAPYTLTNVFGNETTPTGTETDPNGAVVLLPTNTNTPNGEETTPNGEPAGGNGDAFLISLVENDTDVDGLTDEEEASYGTNSTNPDTDGDGLPDGTEVNVEGTDPTNPDTDGDGIPDGEDLDPLTPTEVWSTDSLGNAKSTFLYVEEVYVKGRGFPENTQVTIYIIRDIHKPAPENAKASVNVTTDADGNLPNTLTWSPPLTVGAYDIWVDVNQNGLYDNSDAWNTKGLGVFAFNVIPEPQIIISILLMLGALAIFYFKHNFHMKIPRI